MELKLLLPVTATFTDSAGNKKGLGKTELSSFYHMICDQFQKNPQWQYCQDWGDFIADYKGRSAFADKVQSMEIIPVLEKNGVDAYFVFQSEPALDEKEKELLADYVDKQFAKGWGERLGSLKIPDRDGELQVVLWNPYSSLFLIDDMVSPENVPPKYRITDIRHPVYKECFRIQAIRDVDQDVRAGDLGGYIEKEWNLKHSGRCWIGENAVCHGNAQVCGKSRVSGHAELKEEALVTGNSLIQGNSLIEGNSYIEDAVVEGQSRVTGNAIVESHKDGKWYPVISGNSQIYGAVVGRFVIDNSTVFPEEKLYNRGEDQLLIENGIKGAVSLEQMQKEAVKMEQRIRKTRTREQER